MSLPAQTIPSESEPIQDRPTLAQARRSRWPWFVGAAAVLLLLGVGLVVLFNVAGQPQAPSKAPGTELAAGAQPPLRPTPEPDPQPASEPKPEPKPKPETEPHKANVNPAAPVSDFELTVLERAEFGLKSAQCAFC